MGALKQHLILPRAAVAFLFIFLMGVHFSFAEKTNKIVAIVNGDIVTEEEIIQYLRMSDPQEDEDFVEAKGEELEKKVLDKLIQERLLQQEAERQKIRIDENTIDEKIQDIRQRAGGEKGLEIALRSQGFTLAELKSKFRKQLLIFTLIQKEVRSKVLVNPREVNDYYESRMEQFRIPESVDVDSIFVDNKEALEGVLQQLADGQNFSDLAGRYSKKSNLGEVRRGQLKKELEDFVFSLSVGQCSRPFEFDSGFYLFLIKGKKPSEVLPLEEVKAGIVSNLEQEKFKMMFAQYLENLKEKAYISVRNP